jgi:hypothetical protein
VQDGFVEVAAAVGVPLAQLSAFECKLLCEAPARVARLTAADVRAALRFQGFATRAMVPQLVQRCVASKAPPGSYPLCACVCLVGSRPTTYAGTGMWMAWARWSCDCLSTCARARCHWPRARPCVCTRRPPLRRRWWSRPRASCWCRSSRRPRLLLPRLMPPSPPLHGDPARRQRMVHMCAVYDCKRGWRPAPLTPSFFSVVSHFHSSLSHRQTVSLYFSPSLSLSRSLTRVRACTLARVRVAGPADQGAAAPPILAIFLLAMSWKNGCHGCTRRSSSRSRRSHSSTVRRSGA